MICTIRHIFPGLDIYSQILHNISCRQVYDLDDLDDRFLPEVCIIHLPPRGHDRRSAPPVSRGLFASPGQRRPFRRLRQQPCTVPFHSVRYFDRSRAITSAVFQPRPDGRAADMHLRPWSRRCCRRYRCRLRHQNFCGSQVRQNGPFPTLCSAKYAWKTKAARVPPLLLPLPLLLLPRQLPRYPNAANMVPCPRRAPLSALSTMMQKARATSTPSLSTPPPTPQRQ